MKLTIDKFRKKNVCLNKRKGAKAPDDCLKCHYFRAFKGYVYCALKNTQEDIFIYLLKQKAIKIKQPQ